MDTDTIFSLAQNLIEKTGRNELKWGATSRKTEFVASFQKGTVTCDVWRDERTKTQQADLVVYNEKGDRVLRFVAEPDTRGYDLLTQLNDVARDNYFGTGETIASILSELSTDGPVGKEPKAPDEDVPF